LRVGRDIRKFDKYCREKPYRLFGISK